MSNFVRKSAGGGDSYDDLRFVLSNPYSYAFTNEYETEQVDVTKTQYTFSGYTNSDILAFAARIYGGDDWGDDAPNFQYQVLLSDATWTVAAAFDYKAMTDAPGLVDPIFYLAPATKFIVAVRIESINPMDAGGNTFSVALLGTNIAKHKNK